MPIKNKVTMPLCRPREPCFTPKLNYCFDIPADHLPDRYKDIGVDVLEQYNIDTIQKLPVKQIKYPDLTYLKTFDKRNKFGVFNPNHMEYATELMRILDEAKDVDELISLAVYCRDQLNSELFVYSYYTVLSHRDDTKHFELPQVFEINPHKFFDKKTLSELHAAAYEAENKKRVGRETKPTEVVTIEFPFRGRMSAANTEDKLQFFREDIGINAHHYHWHTAYPFQGPSPKYYIQDRRGELNYFMHNQIMNWYDCTRIALGVPRALPIDNFRESLGVGYVSGLTTADFASIEAPRPDNVFLRDLTRVDSPQTRRTDLERWYDRIMEAIENGYAIDDKGNRVDLINDQGIDHMGNMIEPHPLSLNGKYYGSLHKALHVIICYVHDPGNKYNTQPSVMLDISSAMRDPTFYGVHKMFDDLCSRHKDTLPRYEKDVLKFDAISIKSLDVLNEAGNSVTQLETFWQKSTVDLQFGLDFRPGNQPSRVTFTHLNYKRFTYSLRVENRRNVPIEGMVRVFLLPVKDSSGKDFLYDGCRRLAMHLDLFRCKLLPGINRIKRKSSASTLTVPQERTFPPIKEGPITFLNDPADNVCMCGWPEHMLLPKGNAEGCAYRLFVMISDYTLDKVEQSSEPKGVCSDTIIVCGLKNRKYPDKRPMGYPFDRQASFEVQIFDDLLKDMSNMISKTITIKHRDENTAQVGNDPNKIVKL